MTDKFPLVNKTITPLIDMELVRSPIKIAIKVMIAPTTINLVCTPLPKCLIVAAIP